MIVEERVTILEGHVAQITDLLVMLAKRLRELAVVTYFSTNPSTVENTSNIVQVPVPTEQPPTPQLPDEGWLDCESFVSGRLGRPDMREANQFGQTVARAGLARKIQPRKIAHPGEHWYEVNTWPIEFLREMWHLTSGGEA